MPDHKFAGFISHTGEAGAAPAALTAGATPTSIIEMAEHGKMDLLIRTPREGQLLRFIQEAYELEMPVYVETIEQRILNVRPALPGIPRVEPAPNGDVSVSVGISPARLFIRRDTPGGEEMIATLGEAQRDGQPVLVAANDFDEVIYVRKEGTGRILPLQFDLQIDATALEFRAAPTVTPAECDQMYSQVSQRSCNPGAVPPSCIPFLYPDDGCYARAHEMYHMLGERVSGKTWLYGNLQIRTPNKPGCKQSWVYHVAPFVRVQRGASTIQTVIDPALFPGPVPLDTWRSVQGDPHAQGADSGPSIWYRNPQGKVITDPDYSKTNAALAQFRTLLHQRSIEPGPSHPPYAQCAIA
jgi:Glutaminase